MVVVNYLVSIFSTQNRQTMMCQIWQEKFESFRGVLILAPETTHSGGWLRHPARHLACHMYHSVGVLKVHPDSQTSTAPHITL